MKKSGVLHPGLSRLIAEMGHTDTRAISDAGLPIPACAVQSRGPHRRGHPLRQHHPVFRRLVLISRW
jgi:L-fucose mutarotase/ribose pyranase (RbsD/FucU family)